MKNCIYCGKTLENETVCPRCGKNILEYVAIDAYPYREVPTTFADEIEQQKVSLLYKGDAKKLAEAVRNGQAQVADAVVEKLWIHTESTSEDSEIEYTFANLANAKGCPAPKAVQVVGEAPQEGETAVLFRYLNKKKWKYAVLTKASYDRLAEHLKELLSLTGDGVQSRELPVMEGSIADKVGGFLGGLFSKKKK